MPLPADVSTRVVHGKWLNLLGDPRTGKVVFTPTITQLVDAAEETILTGSAVPATLDPNGEIQVTLPCTDDPDLTGQPFSYLATITLDGDKPYAFNFNLPESPAGVLELATVTPVVPVTPTGTYVASVNGETGIVTLTGADLGLGNSAVLDTGTTGGTVATGDRPETILGLLSPAEWVASTAYSVGQILTHLGFVYRVNTAHTSPATFSTYANLTMLSAPMPGAPVLSGMYSMACLAPGTGTSIVQGNNTLRVSPWYLPNPTTLLGIGCEVTVAGEAGSTVRLGIFADTGGLQPGALLLDAGAVAGDAIARPEIAINQPMVPGLYWIGGAVQGAPTTQPTVTVNGTSVWFPPNAGPVSASSGVQGWAHSGTVSGALPGTFVPNFVSGSAIRVHVKA